MSEPRTEAGERMLDLLYGEGTFTPTDIKAAIRAIEAEARVDLDVGRIAEVFRLMREEDDLPDSSAPDEYVAERFIERLAAIQEEAERE